MEKNVSENTKKSRKVKPNIIDFLIVVAFIAAVVGIIFRMGLADSVFGKDDSTKQVQIEFIVRDINKASYDYFKLGDVFVDKSHSNAVLGTLERLDQPTPAAAYISSVDGEIIYAVSPTLDPNDPESYTRIDVRGMLLCEGTFDKGFFRLNGKHAIMPGSTLNVLSRNVAVTITVVDIITVDAPSAESGEGAQ